MTLSSSPGSGACRLLPKSRWQESQQTIGESLVLGHSQKRLASLLTNHLSYCRLHYLYPTALGSGWVHTSVSQLPSLSAINTCLQCNPTNTRIIDIFIQMIASVGQNRVRYGTSKPTDDLLYLRLKPHQLIHTREIWSIGITCIMCKHVHHLFYGMFTLCIKHVHIIYIAWEYVNHNHT